MDLGQISARGADRILRLSWTVADLDGVGRPGLPQVSSALGLWMGVGI
jgi:magnesium chelatase family protein